MGGSSGGGQVSQSTNQSPWSGQEPWLNMGSNQVWYTGDGQTKTGNIAGLFPRAYEWLNKPAPSYFPGNTIAGFNPDQNSAIGMTRNIAGMGDPTVMNAYNAAGAYAGGDFSNPAIQGALDATRRSVQPGIDARFMQSGRSFSPAHAQSLGMGIADATAPIIFGAQQNAMQQAPGLSQARYGDPNVLMNSGQLQQQQGQAQINADVERHNAEQFKEQNKLAAYSGLIGGQYGGQSLSQGQQPGAGWMSGFGNLFGGTGSLLRGAGSIGKK